MNSLKLEIAFVVVIVIMMFSFIYCRVILRQASLYVLKLLYGNTEGIIHPGLNKFVLKAMGVSSSLNLCLYGQIENFID